MFLIILFIFLRSQFRQTFQALSQIGCSVRNKIFVRRKHPGPAQPERTLARRDREKEVRRNLAAKKIRR